MACEGGVACEGLWRTQGAWHACPGQPPLSTPAPLLRPSAGKLWRLKEAGLWNLDADASFLDIGSGSGMAAATGGSMSGEGGSGRSKIGFEKGSK